MTQHSIPQLTAALGKRIEQYRLLKNLTQIELANQSGIGERTLRRLESGHGGTLDSLIRVLVALKLEHNLDALIPSHDVRPIERTQQSKSERIRASGKRSKASHSGTATGNSATGGPGTSSASISTAGSSQTSGAHKDRSRTNNSQQGSAWVWGDEKP